jgi:hypothetical protein
MKKFLYIFVYVVFLTGISYVINGKSLIGIDDANIYMTYMRNFANGHGFVYNIGGERVEGFTSLLWTLIGALFYKLTIHVEILLLVTNIILTSLCLYNISRTLDEKNDAWFSNKSILFLLLIGVTPGFIDWTVFSLMETGLWCFLITTTAIKIIEYNLKTNKISHYALLSLLIIALVTCRPEAMLWVPVFISMNILKEYHLSTLLRIVGKGSIILFSVFIISLIFLITWRLNYFGYPFPNTYYAKVSSGIIDNLKFGKKYLVALFVQKPFLLFIIFSFLYYLYSNIKRRKNELLYGKPSILFALMCFSLAIPLYTGGDHFELHRFIMPSLPLILLLFILILERKYYETIRDVLVVVTLLFFSNTYNLRDVAINGSYPIRQEWSIAVRGRNTSAELNNFFSQTTLPSQGVLTAGGSAYGYKGETIDLLGLNNTKMAHASKYKDPHLFKNHASFDKNTFFDLAPDILWYEGASFFENYRDAKIEKYPVNTSSLSAIVFQNIHTDNRFKANYAFCVISNNQSTKVLRIFANNKFIARLDSIIYKVEKIDYK